MEYLFKYLLPLGLISFIVCILLVKNNQWNLTSYIVGNCIGCLCANIGWIAAKKSLEEND